MAFYRCKMCGGDLEIIGNETVCECAYCGTKQTVPTANDDKITNLFNRANQLRMVNRFDEAKKIYEDILLEDNTSAEAHWGIILCKYGIEYVDDVKSGKKIPTCHRTIASPIFNDVDYLATLSNADVLNKPVYEAEANEIARIQIGILEQSANAENYDIFICYKETDDTTGARTEDSVIAQDLYFQLEKKGYKTFFARKTLENKLGTEYEPIIFSALNSAKVMVVLGTKPEHFESVWLKNEWSRFLDFTKNDSSRLLIPAYKDFSPYSLPGEFSALQALDMGKIGFMQDLLDAIDRIARTERKTTNLDISVNENNSKVAPLVKRAYMFLEDKEWDKAIEYSERILDLNPENGDAYFCKYLAYINCSNHSALITKIKRAKTTVEKTSDYIKAKKFADSKLLEKLDAIEIAENNRKYEIAKLKMNSNDYVGAIAIFRELSGFNDSNAMIQECISKDKELKEKHEKIQNFKNQINAKNNELQNLIGQKQTAQAELNSYNSRIQQAEMPVDKKVKKVLIVNCIFVALYVLAILFMNIAMKTDPEGSEELTFADNMTFLTMFASMITGIVCLVVNIIFYRKTLQYKDKEFIKAILVMLFVPIVGCPITINKCANIMKKPFKSEMVEGFKKSADHNINVISTIDSKIASVQSEIDQLRINMEQLQNI